MGLFDRFTLYNPNRPPGDFAPVPGVDPQAQLGAVPGLTPDMMPKRPGILDRFGQQNANGYSGWDGLQLAGATLRDVANPGGQAVGQVQSMLAAQQKAGLAKQQQAARVATAVKLFPNDPGRQAAYVANPEPFDKALAQQDEAYTLSEGQVRGQGGRTVQAAPKYVEMGDQLVQTGGGAPAQSVFTRDPTRSELETTRHNTFGEGMDLQKFDLDGKKYDLDKFIRSGELGVARQNAATSSFSAHDASARGWAQENRLAAESTGSALTDDAVQQLAEGFLINRTLPALGMGKSATASRDAILNRAAAMEKASGRTGADAVVAAAGFRAASSALGQTQKQMAAVESFEQTARDNGQIVRSLLTKGAGPSTPLFNRPIQAMRGAMGDPDVAAFHAALETYSSEVAKVNQGNTGAAGATDSVRAATKAMLNPNATPKQLLAAMDVLDRDMANRSKSLKDQLEHQREQLRQGRPAAPAPAPPAAAAPPAPTAPRGPARPAPAAGPAAGAPQRLTPQQAAALAPGTRFVGMDGVERVKH